MIYFDWKKILEATNGNVGDIITIMRIITFRITPKNYYDKTFKFYEKNFHGKEFLENLGQGFDTPWKLPENPPEFLGNPGRT